MATGQYIDAPATEAIATMGSIVHLSDQLSAAVYEVEAAWRDFVHGARPETSTDGNTSPIPTSRIEATRDSINSSIGRLRMITASIRDLT